MDNQNEDIAALKAEIDSLKVQVADLRAALDLESSDTTTRLNYLSKDIIELADYVMPALHTLFPKIADGQKEVRAFFSQRKPPSEQKKD